MPSFSDALFISESCLLLLIMALILSKSIFPEASFSKIISAAPASAKLLALASWWLLVTLGDGMRWMEFQAP